MRPVGSTTVDSSVMDFTADRGGDGAAAAAAATGVEMVGDDRDGAEEIYGEGEVSSQCCGRLSPTAIVYMSAFVSSLTSVLLGYGECAHGLLTPGVGSCGKVEIGLDGVQRALLFSPNGHRVHWIGVHSSCDRCCLRCNYCGVDTIFQEFPDEGTSPLWLVSCCCSGILLLFAKPLPARVCPRQSVWFHPGPIPSK